MTDQMASQMPMAPMEHAHNFMRVPSLVTQKSQRQVDLALATAGTQAAGAQPVIAQLRDRTWQLESLAVMARKMVIGDEPSRSQFTTTLAAILDSGMTGKAEGSSSRSMRAQLSQGDVTANSSQQNGYNLAAVLDVLSGISYCANEPALMSSSPSRLAAYLDDCLSPLLAVSDLAAAMAGPSATRAPGTASVLSSMLVSLGCGCGTCDACQHPSVLVPPSSKTATAFREDLAALVSSWISANPVSYWRSITADHANNAALSRTSLRVSQNRVITLTPAPGQRFTAERERVVVFFPPALPAKLLEWSEMAIVVQPPKQAVSGRIYFSRIPTKTELETLAGLTQKLAASFAAPWSGSFLARVDPVSWMVAPADNAGIPVTIPRPPVLQSFQVYDSAGTLIPADQARRDATVTLTWDVSFAGSGPAPVVTITLNDARYRTGLPLSGWLQVRPASLPGDAGDFVRWGIELRTPGSGVTRSPTAGTPATTTLRANPPAGLTARRMSSTPSIPSPSAPATDQPAAPPPRASLPDAAPAVVTGEQRSAAVEAEPDVVQETSARAPEGPSITAPAVLLLDPGGSSRLDIALSNPTLADALRITSARGLVGIGPVTINGYPGAEGAGGYFASVSIADLAANDPPTDASLSVAYDTLVVTGPVNSESVAVWLTQPNGRWEGVQMNVATTANSATVTTSGGPFTQAQVGQAIVIPGAGVDGTRAGTTLPGTLRATITALHPGNAQTSNSVTISPAAAFTTASAPATVGGVGLQICGVHAVVLSTGDVLYFSYNGDYASQTAGSYGNLPTTFQDINDGLTQRVSSSGLSTNGFHSLSALPAAHTARNMFCACQCLLPDDGQVLIAGGQIFAPAAEKTHNYWGMLESLASTGDGEAFLTIVAGAIAAGILTLPGAVGILGLGVAGAIAAIALAVDLSEPTLPDPHGSTPDVHVFDSTGANLTRLPSMAGGRYYPTCAVLRDGTVLIMGGLDNLYLYTFANVFLSLGSWGDNETVEYFVPPRTVSPPTQSFGQFGALDNYPIVQVLPNTDYIFVHSDDTTQMWIDTGGTGGAQPVSGASFVTPRVDQNGRTAHITYPAQTGAVPLPIREASNPRILAAGGSPVGAADLAFQINEPTDVALQTCSVFTWDLNGSAQNNWGASGWSNLPTLLNSPRVLADTVLLPDSTVLIINGGQRGLAESSSNPVFQPELFDPSDESIRLLAADPTSTPRKYHSTAVLLPDGRVLIAGNTGMYNNNPDIPLSDNSPPAGTPTPNQTPPDTLIATVFHPPCLYRGPRPEVSTGAGGARFPVVAYGSQFEVNYSANQSADIVQASLVRPCAATHSVDMGQRLIELEIISTASAAGTMTLRAPSGGTVAPPGAYMLFVTNALGAISSGSWLFMADTAGVVTT